MERLTRRINGVVVYVGAKNPYSTGQIPCEVEPAGVREMMDRLAAYEDTGRMPEEVTAIQCTLTEYHKVADPLLRAQADGRLVVLPCKVGQRVFALLDTDKHISECEVKQIGMGNKIGFIGLEPIGARGREYGISLNGFGKNVFLTREEAENALGAMKDG